MMRSSQNVPALNFGFITVSARNLKQVLLSCGLLVGSGDGDAALMGRKAPAPARAQSVYLMLLESALRSKAEVVSLSFPERHCPWISLPHVAGRLAQGLMPSGRC